MSESAPNPGSNEAHDQGCTCPRGDNYGGHMAPFPPDGWWIRPDCPLHGPRRGPEDIDPEAVKAVEQDPSA